MANQKKRGSTAADELIDPLDYRLLAELPPQGEQMLGLYPVGATINSIAERDPFNKLPGKPVSVISGRIRGMKDAGYTIDVQTLGDSGTRSWQITARGQEVLAEWKARQS